MFDFNQVISCKINPSLSCAFLSIFIALLAMQSPKQKALHAGVGRGQSGCEGQQAADFVQIFMPGERVVWFPPECLCTGTKGWRRSTEAPQIRMKAWGFSYGRGAD